MARDLGVPIPLHGVKACGCSCAISLLHSVISWRATIFFEAIGGVSGTRYRIRYGPTLNVETLDKNGRRKHMLCFAPKGYLPIGDIMLAQKIALELFEADAIKTANVSPCWELTDRLGPRGPPRRMCRRPPHSA